MIFEERCDDRLPESWGEQALRVCPSSTGALLEPPDEEAGSQKLCVDDVKVTH